MPESFGDVSVVCERKLVPSIDVSIHPTIEKAPPVKEKEVDTIQEEVEKTLGLKITGGVDFKMPITIFHARFFIFKPSILLLLDCDMFFRSRMIRKLSELALSSGIRLRQSRIKKRSL